MTGQGAAGVAATVRFRLLGPLRVSIDGTAVDMGSPKARILLAFLLLRAGHTVPVDELADAVWGEELPLKPRRAVQLYVTRLRALGQGQLGRSISTSAEGYRIDVPPESLDLQRFEALLEQAGRAAANGDVESEAAALRAALDEWTGEPLADVPSERLQRQVVPHLAERRLVALERRIDADLRRGRTAELVSELLPLTEQHPLRERLWAQLMTALARAGRRADALAAYHTVRARLAGELGIDPGDELRRLHAEILGGSARPEAGRITVPRQLPSDVRGFVGRQGELAHLDALLDAADADPTAPTTCVITGMAGVGKTTLAVHWARRVADRFGDGQLWIDLRGHDPRQQPVRPEQALGHFLQALGVPGPQVPVDPAGQAGLYQSLMDGRRTLVVLDNARDLEQIRPLLPGGPRCLVLVTSRHRLTAVVAATGARPLPLGLFSIDEARNLIVRRVGEHRVRGQRRAVDAIIGVCARLPLALAIVSARAATQQTSLGALASELRDPAGRLDALSSDSEVVDVRSVFSWSYQALSAGAARLFRLLSLHPGPDVPAPAAASLLGLAPQRIRSLLAELCSAHLLGEPTPGRYALHDLLRISAGELCAQHDPPAEREAAVRRVYDHYLHTASAAARALNPQRDAIALGPLADGVTVARPSNHDDAWAWLGVELPVLLAAVEQPASDLDGHVWRLAWALVEYLDRRGRWQDLATVQRAGLLAAQRSDDVAGQALCHRGLGQAAASLGRWDEAHEHYTAALALFARLGDPIGQARVHRNLAWMHGQREDHEQAHRHTLEALALFRAAGNAAGEANTLNAIGWYLAQLGRFGEALDHCRSALAMLRELGNRTGEAYACDSVGYIHHRLGEYDDACAAYEQALQLFRRIGNRREEATTLTHYGDTLEARGDVNQALEAWKLALDILTELDHPDAARVEQKLRSAATASR